MIDIEQLKKLGQPPEDMQPRRIDPSALSEQTSGYITLAAKAHEKYIEYALYSLGFQEYVILQFYSPTDVYILRWSAEKKEKQEGKKND